MRLTWAISLFAALSVRNCIAQGVSLPFPVNTECVGLNQIVVAQAANGRLAEAERVLSAALAGGAGRTADSCAGLALNNIAALLLATGRLVNGERLAERSVAILEKVYAPDDLVLLRPLQVLTVIRFEQGKIARAREAVKKMQSIRVERRSIEISPISLAEVIYLIEKNRLPASAFDDLRNALDNPNHLFKEAPFTGDVVKTMRQGPRDEVPDMPDRIVAATSGSFWRARHQP